MYSLSLLIAFCILFLPNVHSMTTLGACLASQVMALIMFRIIETNYFSCTYERNFDLN